MNMNRFRSLNMLAVALYHVGHFSETGPLARQVLAINEKALGAEHPSTMTICTKLSELEG